MITAHLPAGYLTGRSITASRPVIVAATLGGVFPDLDMIWFYLIDDRAFHHHHYWVHIPFFWAVVAALTLPLIAALRKGWLLCALAFFAAIFVHLCLDTIAGDIKWLWPWQNTFFRLIEIPAIRPHWVLNFILHPVFLLEMLIWATAFYLLWRQRAPAT